MQWIEISIYTTHAGIEAVSGRLEMLGIGGVMIIDKEDFEDFVAHNLRAWDMVDEALYEENAHAETCVRAYISDIPENEALLSEVQNSIAELKDYDKEGAFGRLEIRTDRLEEADWQNGWKQYYKPLKIGSRVLIKPSWEEVYPKDNEVVVELDPGMAFGTGTHETTHMCVLLLEKYLKPAQNVLDIGTGSGILAITCARLGAGAVTGVDIDPLAVKIARENVALNGLSDSVSVAEGDLVDAVNGTYDLVVANIIADVIKLLAPRVPPFIKEGGLLIASGIIKDKYQMVKEAVTAAGLTIIEETDMNEWCALVARK